jgi:hypothetical protein
MVAEYGPAVSLLIIRYFADRTTISAARRWLCIDEIDAVATQTKATLVKDSLLMRRSYYGY